MSYAQKIFYRHIYSCEQKSLTHSDVVTCVSRSTQEQLESIFGYSDSLVIYNGVNPQLFKPMAVNRDKYLNNSKKTLLFFSGNLIKRKGADLLPRIMEKLGDNFLLLTTSGLNNAQFNGMKNILTLGKVTLNHLVELYNVCDIFLYPSRLEGFGLSVAEAMACEKPIVTTKISSLPELVIDGLGGFLCEMDNISDFVEKIQILSEDATLRRTMGEFNRKRILEKFTLDMMAEQYARLYSKLI